jgi:hypothetical protein
MIIAGNKLDFFLIKFPIIFPIVYFLLLVNFPAYENFLIIFTILFLAEPHFGATFPFFINKINKQYIISNKFYLIYLPIIILILCFLGFFFFKNLFFLIFFGFNIYHVTRQSFGVAKLYSNNSIELKNIEITIYLWNIIFFFVAIFRFYYPFITAEHLNILNICIIIILFLNFVYYLLRFKFNSNFFILFTGVIIFYPACFVDNPVHVILMGVTMHFSQYLAFTYKVTKERQLKDNKKNNLSFIIKITLYSTIMTIFSLSVQTDLELIKNLIIIPISAQMLHFYIDSRLWRFSEPHNRLVVLDFLKKQPN